MVEAVFIDLDGTLLDESHEISEANKSALKKLDALNIPYFIATGRPEQLVKKVVKDLDYKRDLILMNGSVIGHPFQLNRTRNMVIESKLAHEIIEYCIAHKHLVMLYTQFAIFSDYNERVAYFEEKNKTYPKECRAVFKSLKSYAEEPINKILIVERDDSRYANLVDVMSHDSLVCVQSQKGFLDINPKLASKGNAVKQILTTYNFDGQNVVAIGDQDNDLSMREYVGHFVAMNNAVDKIKRAADEITLSNVEDGVAVWINKTINRLNICSI